jgi:CRISPR-associated endoribonuclease Cas6
LRVRIIFLLKNRGTFIPFHHQFLIAQMLKAVAMVGGDRSFLTFKGFNFSGLKGQTKSSRKGLHYYSSRVTLVLASRNIDYLNYLLLNMFKMKQVQLGDLILEPERVEVERIPDLTSFEKFICLSPLVLDEPSLTSDQAVTYVDPQSDEFSDRLYDLVMQHVESLSLYSQEVMATFNQFQVVPDKEYLAKLMENNKKFSRVYFTYDQDVKFDIRGYTFPFYFYGAPELKEVFFLDGLGAIPHKGFGMLDLANEDPNARVEPYEVPGL